MNRSEREKVQAAQAARYAAVFTKLESPARPLKFPRGLETKWIVVERAKRSGRVRMLEIGGKQSLWTVRALWDRCFKTIISGSGTGFRHSSIKAIYPADHESRRWAVLYAATPASRSLPGMVEMGLPVFAEIALAAWREQSGDNDHAVCYPIA